MTRDAVRSTGSPAHGTDGKKGPLTRTKPRLTGIAKTRSKMQERNDRWEKQRREIEETIRRAKKRAGRLNEKKEKERKHEEQKKVVRKTLGKRSFMSKLRNHIKMMSFNIEGVNDANCLKEEKQKTTQVKAT